MKPKLWKENGLWWCSDSRTSCLKFPGTTPEEAWKKRVFWLGKPVL